MNPYLPQIPNSKLRTVGIAVTYALVVSACAGIPAPTEQMAVSKLSVSNATSAGGNEYAPLTLKTAMEKLDAAERAMAAENYAEAKLLAEEAQVDAQLAAAAARSSKAQKAASTLMDDNRVLRHELDRKAQ